MLRKELDTFPHYSQQSMTDIDPYEDTQAFVSTVKLGKLGIDLKDIAIFFPDALLIEDKDFRDRDFGEGLFLLLHTDIKRFAKIIEYHVKNYSVLGYKLVELNSCPEGKLAGMFILSIAIKNSGEELFEQMPSPDFFKKILERIRDIPNHPQKMVNQILNLPTPQGIKKEFHKVASPKFYWEKFKEPLNGRTTKEHIYAFLSFLTAIYSAFLVSADRYHKKKIKTMHINTSSPVGTVSTIELKKE